MSLARRSLKLILPLLILAGAGFAVFMLLATRPETVAEPVEERAWPVHVQPVTISAHQPVLNLQGFLEAPRGATLRSAVEGDVATVHVREGDRVEEGALLVELDDRELRLTLREREAEVAELEAQLALERRQVASNREELAIEERVLELAAGELKRLQDLAEQEFTPRADVDRAQRELEEQRLAVTSRMLAVAGADDRLSRLEAQLDRASALRDRAELDRQRGRIKAPFNGRVARLDVARGDRVMPGETLLAMYDLDSLEIRVTVPTAHLARLRLSAALDGSEAVATVDGQQVPVQLSRFGGQVDRGVGGVEALFAVTEAEDLVLGRFATVWLRLPAEPDSVLLPFEALYDTHRIYRVIDDRMDALDVERLGEATLPDGRRGALVRVPDLRDGDLVVTTQLPQAMHGLRVRMLDNGPAR
jgi:HlyD family secretion protein